MTDNNAEREKRKRYLKDLLRTKRTLRQHLEAVRRPPWLQDIYQDAQLRWEVGQELEREEAEAAAAAKRRQQEAEAQPESAKVDPPSSELRDATDDEIRDALRRIYEPFLPGAEREGQGPNLADIYPLALADLEKLGLTATKRCIQDIADEKEFDGARGRQGKRRT
jgi:hypothetical protein